VNTGNGTTSVQAYSTYNLFAGQTLQSFTDKTGAPGIILEGIFQLQGSCTYTEPAVVGTFAGFSSTYSAATYVSLIDVRDNKIYPVVKIGGRWIMARNLNYQKDLTWQANSNQPTSSTVTPVTALIGNFWCPGGYSSTMTTSTRESCDVWGALYSWETAMMLDGYGTWMEVSTYSTEINQGRTAHSGSGTGGRGICPPNWHIPTDNEWGIILGGMESGGGTAHQNASSIGWIGADAGVRGKSKCTPPDNVTSGDTYVNDTQANWYYHSNRGTDVYGFRVLPSGYRNTNGSAFTNRGYTAWFWSSSVVSRSGAWYRYFDYSNTAVYRGNGATRCRGFSVRCIRN
jgi:uncharacterized protein (TIGR02145 family)